MSYNMPCIEFQRIEQEMSEILDQSEGGAIGSAYRHGTANESDKEKKIRIKGCGWFEQSDTNTNTIETPWKSRERIVSQPSTPSPAKDKTKITLQARDNVYMPKSRFHPAF